MLALPQASPLYAIKVNFGSTFMLFFSDVRAHALPGQRTQIIAKEFFLKEIGLERRQRSRELSARSEGLDLIPRSHMVAHNDSNSSSKRPKGHPCACRQKIHTYRNNSKKIKNGIL